MSSSCTSILVGVISLVSEIWLPFKNGQISLSGHGLQSMVIEKFNRSESAQKFMQVGNDVKFMHTDFGGCGFLGFGDMATF